jgi:hypothetical protein
MDTEPGAQNQTAYLLMQSMEGLTNGQVHVQNHNLPAFRYELICSVAMEEVRDLLACELLRKHNDRQDNDALVVLLSHGELSTLAKTAQAAFLQLRRRVMLVNINEQFLSLPIKPPNMQWTEPTNQNCTMKSQHSLSDARPCARTHA